MVLASGCGDGDGDEEKAGKKPAASASVDCADQSIGQAKWMKYCADEAPDGSGTGGDGTTGAEPQALGTAVETVADGGDETSASLRVTPLSVVYIPGDGSTEPDNGLFAAVLVKAENEGTAAAEQTAPIVGGGWQWVGPDGQAVSVMDGQATSITSNKFSGGTWKWDLQVFDLREDQRGGTLIYTDGAEAEFRWTVPAKDAGPKAAEVRADLVG